MYNLLLKLLYKGTVGISILHKIEQIEMQSRITEENGDMKHITISERIVRQVTPLFYFVFGQTST